MDESKEILEELKSISPAMSEIKKIPIGCVPIGYFDALPNRILEWVLANEEERIISKEEIPNRYFENLSGRIIATIHENEETKKEIDNFEIEFPILHSLKNKRVLEVPDGYFEEVVPIIMDKCETKKKASIISLSTKWWKYAVAAILSGAMMIGAFQFYNNFTTTKKINNYLISSTQYKTADQINQGIASLNDDDIIAYLENHGNITDNSLLTTDVNVNELPSVEDYLINENALKDYLKGLENTQTH